MKFIKKHRNTSILSLFLYLSLFNTNLLLSQHAHGFKHAAEGMSINQNATIIDNPITNNDPEKLLFVCHDNETGLYDNSALGVWYTKGKWSIFKQDKKPLNANAKFNVLVKSKNDTDVFVPKAQNVAVFGDTGGNQPTPNVQKKMTNFDPKKHGFKFVNRFDNHGYFAGVNINFTGLCGGMSYSALDYYYSRTPIPTTSKVPNEGTNLNRYIRQRQHDTYSAQADKWIEHGFNPFGWRTMEFWNWGIQGFNGGRLEELMKKIDNGSPVPLGLFAAGDGGFSSKHHQVIAIGYNLNGYDGKLRTNKENLEIYIYDPNCPNVTRTLKPKYNTNNPRYYYVEEPHKEWLTYFVDNNYRSKTPMSADVLNGCANKNIKGKNLSGKNISNKNYRCSKGKKANLYGATLNGVDFYKSELENSSFYGARSHGVNFEKCNLSNSNFEGADVKNSTFDQATLIKVRFYGADLKDVKMKNANAYNSNFEGADLHRGKFNGTSFVNARFYGTSLNTIECRNCDFRGANLDRADLRGSDFTGSKFDGARITKNTLIDGNTRGIPVKYLKN